MFTICSIGESYSAELDPHDLGALLKTLDASGATEAPRILQRDGGFVSFIGAPPGAGFETDASRSKAAFLPEDLATKFVKAHSKVFGVSSARTDFRPEHVFTRKGRYYVHLQQTYGGIDVYGGRFMVLANSEGQVLAVLGDPMRETGQLDSGELSLLPWISAESAADGARIDTSADTGLNVDNLTATVPELYIYRPSVLGNSGVTRLAWVTDVASLEDPTVRERHFVDAHSGESIFKYSLVETLKDRLIYDASNFLPFSFPFFTSFPLVRAEDEDETRIPDVDQAYDFLGDTYDFYQVHHGRDGIDDLGSPLIAVVRVGTNLFNAFWDGVEMLFGEGFVIDDVTAHEMTHGVTQFTSGLLGFNESGAINESFSDIWGEFVDLENAGGTDTEEVEWLIGEDLPAFFRAFVPTRNPPARALRNMQDPTEFTWFPFDKRREFITPDRYNHPDFYRGLDDAGGVHFNSGVGNKLAYLLTAGGIFNGFKVDPMLIPTVADLFYETQFILLPASDYFDLFAALQEATFTIEPRMSFDDRLNVQRAVRAVEIVPPESAVVVEGFRALPATNADNIPVVVVEWKDLAGTGLQVVVILRKQGSFPTDTDDGDKIFPIGSTGIEEAHMVVDGEDVLLVPGEEYFYAVFWTRSNALPGADYARVTVGDPIPSFLTERFFESGGQPLDLAFKQLLFSPTVNSKAAEASGRSTEYVNYTDYEASITNDVFELPVSRSDARGTATTLSLTDDDLTSLSFEGRFFPYFGKFFNGLTIAANGYVNFGSTCEFCSDNFPSINAHMDNLRISALFTDLAVSAGGSVWTRVLDDRIVVTYENVPEFAVSFPFLPGTNTVQLELFFSGHIRMTFLELAAEEAIVGLSDGLGIVTDPAEHLPGTTAAVRPTDLSTLPEGNAAALTIWPPVPSQVALEGAVVEFTVTTNSPNGVPRLEASWERPEALPFADNLDGTGTFQWTTDASSSGVTTLDIVALLGNEAASQSVQIFVTNVTEKPEAQNVVMLARSGGAVEIAQALVDNAQGLEAQYDYFHPEEATIPQSAGEGATSLQWFRNGALVPTLSSSDTVSAGLTRVGDTWFYAVRPRTLGSVSGELIVSPSVTIVSNPVISQSQINPSVASTEGGRKIRITGRNLSKPLSVSFGGILGVGLASLGDEELEVTTPAKNVGRVDLVVTTETGTATVVAGFEFVSAAQLKADVNKDGWVNAIDIQLVISAVLYQNKRFVSADTNDDGLLNSVDIQVVVNAALTL